MIPLIYLTIFLAITFSIGKKITAKFEFTKVEQLVISVALGSGILMFLTFFLGIFKLLYKEVFLVLALLLAIFLFKEIIYFGYLIRLLTGRIIKKFKPNLLGFLLAIYILFIVINLISAFAPVFTWDSVQYHLAFSKNYIRQHALTPNPSHHISYTPQGMTILYIISELFFPGTFSVLIVYAFSILGSLGIYSIVRKYSSDTSAIMSSLIFLTIPVVTERLTQTGIDLATTYFFICAIIILLKYIEKGDNKIRFNLLILLSFFMGCCLFIKLTGVFLLISVVIGILSYWILYKKKIRLKEIVILLFLCLIFLSPWLVRAYIYTGNPVYPFAYKIFDEKYVGSLSDEIDDYSTYINMKRSPINALLVLWNITFRSKAFGSIMGISPFYLMILPLIFFFYKDISDLKIWVFLFIIAISICIIVFITCPMTRYLFPALALFTILIGIIIDSMMKRSKLLKTIIVLLFILLLVFNFAIWGGIYYKNLHFIFTPQTKEEYYSNLKDHNPYTAMKWINENTEPDSRIYLFLELRGYYLERDYIYWSPYLLYINFHNMTNSNDLLRRLKELDVSYILINEGVIEIIKNSPVGEFHHLSWPIVQDLVSSNADLLYNKSQKLVYKIV